ncbi:MAG: P1 family peptidase [Promethearchaeota archaeon]
MMRTIRARDLGVPLDGNPGQYNAITDVKGVELGHTTIIQGEGKLNVGKGPIRTGVTAILPRGKSGLLTNNAVYAAWYSLNGNGEMTGTTWIEESGFLEGPVMITNTHSVGVVRDAVIKWLVHSKAREIKEIFWALPVVAETWDGRLNDINGFHVKEEHVFNAIDNASSGNVQEGNVGGGTGMICHGFKGGIGTSSRVIPSGAGKYTVGVLVQANYGYRHHLTIAGVPIGKEIQNLKPIIGSKRANAEETGSIIVVVATDAPLLPYQLKRLTKRIPIGIGRVGGFGSHGSGDIFIAFSTANTDTWEDQKDIERKVNTVDTLKNNQMDALFLATIEATEEAILNALITAKTMRGINDFTVFALPHDRLQQILEQYGRLKK